uniref:Immunoglobulin V-set domain-containing protein n=1 Tax=Hippocampus comes TaxID=109280 RepID=A0A3Q2Z4Q5_HIPCM
NPWGPCRRSILNHRSSSCDEGSVTKSKFVKQGADVDLDVKKPVVFTPDRDLFFWRVNRSLDIFRSDKNQKRTKIYPNYHGRVVVLENFSLVLKNVQEPDAGLYTAVLSGAENKLAEYQLHIQAAVSPVKLEVVSLFADSDSCNLTVTCRTDQTHLNATFECRHANCTPDGGGLSNADWSLMAFVFNFSIVCQHSNQVSETQEAMAVRQVCQQHVPKEISIFTWTWIRISLVLGLALALIFALRRRERQATRKPEGCQVLESYNMGDITKDRVRPCTLKLRPAELPKMLEADPMQVTGQNNNPLLAL